MKFFTFILATFISVSAVFGSFTIVRAKSDNEYLRVITEDTPIFATDDGKDFLCFLPYTYYVKVLSNGERFTHVLCYGINCPAIDGYVPTDYLFSDGLSVQNPYLDLKVRANNTLVLYRDTELTQSVRYVFADREMSVYGLAKTNTNEEIVYVSYLDDIGYVRKSDLNSFTILNHPNELTFIITPEPTPPTLEEQNGYIESGLAVACIGCLILAGLTALFVAIRNKNKAHLAVTSYYDENEFE